MASARRRGSSPAGRRRAADQSLVRRSRRRPPRRPRPDPLRPAAPVRDRRPRRCQVAHGQGPRGRLRVAPRRSRDGIRAPGHPPRRPGSLRPVCRRLVGGLPARQGGSRRQPNGDGSEDDRQRHRLRRLDTPRPAAPGRLRRPTAARRAHRTPTCRPSGGPRPMGLPALRVDRDRRWAPSHGRPGTPTRGRRRSVRERQHRLGDRAFDARRRARHLPGRP